MEVYSRLEEIQAGYTIIDGLVFKHFDSIDLEKIDIVYSNNLENVKKQGVKTTKELLQSAIDNGDWSDSEESMLASIDKRIQSTKKEIPSLILDQQKEQLRATIGKFEEKKKELISKKALLTYSSAEFYAESWTVRYQVSLSLKKGTDLKTNKYSYEQFEELEDDEYDDILNKYYIFYKRFGLNELKKLALSYNFRKLIDIGGEFQVFNKPLIELTHFQSQLLILTKNYCSMIASKNGAVPNDCLSDPVLFEKWFSESRELESQSSSGPKKNSVNNDLIKNLKKKKKMPMSEISKTT